MRALARVLAHGEAHTCHGSCLCGAHRIRASPRSFSPPIGALIYMMMTISADSSHTAIHKSGFNSESGGRRSLYSDSNKPTKCIVRRLVRGGMHLRLLFTIYFLSLRHCAQIGPGRASSPTTTTKKTQKKN